MSWGCLFFSVAAFYIVENTVSGLSILSLSVPSGWNALIQYFPLICQRHQRINCRVLYFHKTTKVFFGLMSSIAPKSLRLNALRQYFPIICQRLMRQIDDSCLWKTLIKLLKNQGPFRPYVFNRSYIPSGWKLPDTLPQFAVCASMTVVCKSHFLNIFWKSQKRVSRTP